MSGDAALAAGACQVMELRLFDVGTPQLWLSPP
jgi:hypothetical protein